MKASFVLTNQLAWQRADQFYAKAGVPPPTRSFFGSAMSLFALTFLGLGFAWLLSYWTITTTELTTAHNDEIIWTIKIGALSAAAATLVGVYRFSVLRPTVLWALSCVICGGLVGGALTMVTAAPFFESLDFRNANVRQQVEYFPIKAIYSERGGFGPNYNALLPDIGKRFTISRNDFSRSLRRQARNASASLCLKVPTQSTSTFTRIMHSSVAVLPDRSAVRCPSTVKSRYAPAGFLMLGWRH